MARATVRESSSQPNYPRYPVSDLKLEVKNSLKLDENNPRLVEFGLDKNASQFDILKALWEKMAVEEVAMSIAYNGYFEHEPLFAEENAQGELIVIEGNRRLAAVMLLLYGELRKKLRATDLPDIDTIDKNRREEISELPVIITRREEIWRYLGFKHVNGPSEWGSYAKAQYIARVRNEYNVRLEDIAKQIGDYSYTVKRMYRGLMVIEQAEKAKVFSRKDTAKKGFFFNYIYTALDYPGFQKFLGIEGKARSEREPVPPSKLKHLGELCEWLYGSQSKNKQSVIRSQNPDLKTLDKILLDDKGRGAKALRDGLPLNVAYEISQGDERIFRSALQQTKEALQKAHGTMSTGYSPEDSEALTTATEIDQLAGDLLDGMIRKRTRRRSEG